MRKHQLAIGVLAFLAAAAASASTYPEFTVNPAQFNQSYFTGPSINSVTPFGGTFTANQIAGNYNEIVSFDGLGNFAVSLRFNATSFNLVAASGTTVPSPSTTGLGINELPTSPFPGFTQSRDGYGLYALLLGTGTVSAGPSGPVLTLNPGGTVEMYADDKVDTTFSNPLTGAMAYGRTNAGDDILLATGGVNFGQATTKPCTTGVGQTDCGSFGQNTSFSLTPAGKNFFVAPAPQFYNMSFQSGVLNSNINTGVGHRDFSGQLNIVFVGDVPEPTSLALVGLALLGLGVASRRKA